MKAVRFISVFVLLLLAQLSIAQDKPPVFFSGKVKNVSNDAPMGGVTVEIKKNGTVIETKTTGSNGKFKLNPVEIDAKYTITFKSAGFITRYIEIDLTGIPPAHYQVDGWEQPFDMSMVPEVKDVDYSSVNNKPTTVFKYNPREENILFDDKATATYKSELDKVLKKIEEMQKGDAEKEKKFQQLVAEGDAAVGKSDFQTAVNKYTEALAVKDDPAIKTKLTDAQKKFEAAEAAKGTDKKYQEFLANGDNAMKQKDWAYAKSQYEEAKKLKPAEKLPQDKINEINAIIQAEMKKDEDYNKFIEAGNAAMAKKSYDDAIRQYQEAQKLKPTESLPKELIDKANDEKRNAAAKEKEFADLVKKGDDYAVKKNFDDAITSYEAALLIKEDATVKTKLEKVKTDKAAAEKNSQIDKDYQAALEKGDKAMSESKWDDAIAAYETAKGLKPAEKKPQDQITLAKQKKADEAANAEKEKQYTDLMKKGSESMSASKWDDAIASYDQASKLKPTEQEPKDQIALAKQKKADESANAAKEKQYQDLMTRAEGEMTAKTWDKAIATYEAALQIKPDEQKPKDQIEQAKKNKQNEADAAASLKKAQELVAKGDAAMPKKSYDEAIDYYQQAIDLVKDDATQKKLDAAKEAKAADEKANAEKEAKEKEYNNLITAADNSFGNNAWDDAIAKYNEALKIKPTEKYPAEQIAKAKQNIEADKKNAELNKKYADLMTQGESEMGNKSWDKAITAYTEASKLKPDEQKPKDQIELAKQKKQEDADRATLEKKAKDLIAKGDAAMPLKKFDDAISSYQQAYDLINDPETQKKIDAAKKAKEDETSAQQKAQEEADRLALGKKAKEFIAKGDAAMPLKKFDDAISNYQQAYDLINDPETQKKIDAAKKAKEDEELAKQNAAEKEEKYKSLIAEADNEFSASNWQNAVDKYNSALNIKPGEKYPTDRIALAKQKIAALQASEAEKQAKYKAAMDAGIASYSAGEFDKAINSFEQALTFIPDDPQAKEYIDKANKEKAAKQEQYKKMYDDIIRQADKDFDAKNYEDAKRYYQQAANLFKNEQYPKDRLVEIETKMAAEKDYAAKKAQYDAAIVKADAEFAAKKYETAIASYNAALKILDEQYPKDQIAKANEEINKLKSETDRLAQLENEYKELIKQADAAFTANELDNALNLYNEAKTKKPSEKYPDDQIAKINAKRGELSKLEEIKRKYEAKIAEADTKFNGEQYEDAKKLYAQAHDLKGDETYPQEMIDKANAKLKEITSNELKKQYDLIIAQADRDFDAKNYSDAKGYYERASGMNPNDAYPKNRLKEIETILASETANAEKKVQYDQLVKRADKELNANDFDKAIASYSEALKIIPSEQYPQDQIAEANRRKAEYLAKQGAKKRYEDAMNKGMNNYNAGSFDAAIVNFESALEAIPDDTEATKMLGKAKDELEKKKKFFEEQYALIIKSADENFNDKKYADAKDLYKRAKTLKKDDPYPQQQLDRIAEIEAQVASQKSDADNYNTVIADANKKFNAKDYAEARDLYVQASNLMPAIEFPKNRIKEIDKLLNANNNVNNQQTFATNNANNQPQNAAIVKEKYYGNEVNISPEEAQKIMQKARTDEEGYKYVTTQGEMLKQELDLMHFSETAEVKRLGNQEVYDAQKEKQNNYNEKGEGNRQDNVSSFSNLKEERYNKEADLSHDRNDFLIQESQKYEQIKIDYVYSAVGTDEIRQENVKETAELKEERYNAESALEGNTEEKRLDKSDQLRDDNFRLQDQMGSMDTMRVNNANWMADYKEKRYVAEAELEGETDEKRMARNDQLRDDNFRLQDQMGSMDTMRVNNANWMADYKEKRYVAEAALEGETDEKRMARNDQLRDDNFRLQDQMGSMDTMRVNNANWMADYKEKRYVAEAALEGETDEKRMARNDQLRDDNFRLQDQMGSMDTMRVNNANWMADYKEKRYVAEAALEGETDEKRMAKNDQLHNDNFRLQDQLSTMDTMRFNNANHFAYYKEERYNSESEISSKNEEKVYAVKDTLTARQIKAEEKAAEMAKYPDDNVRELKEQEDARNKQTEETAANGDTKRANNQADLENKKYEDVYHGDDNTAVLVSEKSFQRDDNNGIPHEITIQRMVRKGNTTYEYLMIVNKQGNSYFKNGQPISETQWTVETGVPKE